MRKKKKQTGKEILKERRITKISKGYKTGIKILYKREKETLTCIRNLVQRKYKMCSELKESKSKTKMWARTEDG